MTNSWRQVFTELTNFIAEHPEIEIEEARVIIPENTRLEFNRLFRAVRAAFINEKFPGFLAAAKPLSQSFVKAEQEVGKLLDLEGVSIPDRLNWFLRDPVDGLVRELWILLFELLKRRIDIATFEKKGSERIGLIFDLFYEAGYGSWMELSLVDLLESKKLLKVSVLTAGTEFGHVEGEAVLLFNRPVPPPQESKQLSFCRGLAHTSFTVPDFIVYSGKVGRYVAARAEIRQATWNAANASENREWYPLVNYQAIFEPGYALLYVDDGPEEISLVLDVDKVCRPDLIIEFRGQEDWYVKEGLTKVKLRHDILNPKLGTYIVSRQPLPEQASAELVEGIHILTVDFDTTKLVPIVDALTDLDPG